MKKNAIGIFVFFLASQCSVLPTVESVIGTEFIDQIGGRLFSNNTSSSFIFLSQESTVVIKNNQNSAGNSYYRLTEGVQHKNDLVTYKLQGVGTYKNHYIGVRITKGIETEAGISVQLTRSMAANAADSVGTSGAIVGFSSGEPLQSPAMYALELLSPIIKTSRAGTFKDDNKEFIIFTNINIDPNGSVFGSARFTRTGPNIATPTEIPLVFQTNVSDSKSVFSYTDTANQTVFLGIVLDTQSSVPRLQIIESISLSPNPSSIEIDVFAQSIKNNSIWEYTVSSAIRASDNGLITFQTSAWLQPLASNDRVYDPLNFTRWFIDGTQDVLYVSYFSSRGFVEESYLLQITEQQGVYLLEDDNPLNPQLYSNKYLKVDIDGNIQNAVIKIANSIADIEKTSTVFNVKPQDALDALELKASTPNKFTLSLGAPRSAFQAYVQESTKNIYVVAGFTNSTYLPSSLPRYQNGLGALPESYNDVWVIKNILSTPSTENSGSKIERPTISGATPERFFQQPIGAQTPAYNKLSREIFWLIGAGASSEDGASRFGLNNNPGNVNWSTSENTVFNMSYHFAMTSHKEDLFVVGGMQTPDTFIEESAGPEVQGTLVNTVLIANNSSQASSAQWTAVPTKGTMWTPRVHARLFSVGSTLVLVGGMSENAGNVVPVNDVWVSGNNGTNWTMVNNGTTDGPPKQTSKHQGPLAGTVHKGIIYLVEPATRNLYYSADRGTTWHKSAQGFETSPATPIYGAQLVSVDNSLVLIGGQTIAPSSPSGTSTSVAPSGMEDSIYRVTISSQ